MTNPQLPPTYDPTGRYTVIPRVLCFVTHGSHVLMLKGAPTKKLWANQYNGLGGHVERGESVHAAARREIMEEAGIAITNLRLRGVVTIDTGETPGIGMFVFTARAASRDTTASPEGTLEWVPFSQAPALDAVEDLPVLIPYIFNQAPDAPPFSAQYRYDADGKLVMEIASQ